MISIPQSEHEFINALYKAAELGANRAIEKAGLDKKYISLKEAYKLYHEAEVKRWRKEGLIKVEKDGPRNSKCRIERARIEAVAAASNRITYLPTKER